MTNPEFEVAVIGAGPGGICAGVRLKAAGIEDFVILERGDDVGGSWRDNTYPGIGVDLPATSYQFSFARNREWSRLFPKGDEIQRYHQRVAREHGLYARLRFGQNVVREVWDDDGGFWRLHFSDGASLSARFVISAVGGYVNPKLDVGIAGLADFTGKVIRPHAWDHSFDYAGKRVAVIGTGASSVQLVPALSPEVAQLDVYQRTAVWCAPKPDLVFGAWGRRLLRLPGFGALANAALLAVIQVATFLATHLPYRIAVLGMQLLDAGARRAYRCYLRSQVKDEATRQALLPQYGCLGKRPTISNGFVQAFNGPSTRLVTTAIDRFTTTGLRTVDGIERDYDLIVPAVGYELFSDPETYRPGTVLGRDGFDLGLYYREHGLRAYASVTIPKMPNRWMLVGPYSWSGSAWHSIVELTSRHAVRAIGEAHRRAMEVAEVTQVAHDDWHQMIVRRGRIINHYLLERQRGLKTYYVNSQGHSPYIRPTTVLQSIRHSKHFSFDDYAFTSRQKG